MQKSITLLLTTCYLLLATSYCGKKQPIGYEMVKPREGEIKIAKVESVLPYPIHSEFATTKGASSLFVGKENGFEAITFIYFEFESLQTPESLWVVGRNPGNIQICKVLDSLDMDSVNWSSRPDSFEWLDTIEIKEEDTSVVCIENWGSDTLFYIGFINTAQMVNFRRPWITIKGDTFTHLPMKSIYIDTSYFSPDSLPDSLTYIETGAFVTRCTLYLKLYLIDSISADSTDTMWAEIDSLTDSLRNTYGLDSATINEAEFQISIDESYSYKKDIEILAKYEVDEEKVFSSSSMVEGDSLTLSIKPIVKKWFKKGKELWIVLEGQTKEIARVALIPKTAKFFIVYTLPPKGRE